MDIEFPIEVVAYAKTPAAVALAVALIVQFLIKPQLGDKWRWTVPIALVIAEIWAITATLIVAHWRPEGESAFRGVMVGFYGWGLAVGGYEGIVGILGLLGKGPRSNDALQVQAQRLVRCEEPRRAVGR